MRKIKKGDSVIVIAGKDKGKTGAVLRVLDQGKRLLIEGINLVKKHVKPNPQAGVEGGIVTKEASIHHSNVAIYNPQSQKQDRVRIKVLEDGRRVRIFASNGEVIDV